MNRYDARQQFIDGLDRYVSGIETDEGLARLAENVSANHDRIPILCARSYGPADGSPPATLGHLRSCLSACGRSDKRTVSQPTTGSEERACRSWLGTSLC